MNTRKIIQFMAGSIREESYVVLDFYNSDTYGSLYRPGIVGFGRGRHAFETGSIAEVVAHVVRRYPVFAPHAAAMTERLCAEFNEPC